MLVYLLSFLMKFVAVLYALLGLTTLVNGQSFLTIHDAAEVTYARTGLPAAASADLDYYMNIGASNGETTYLENQVKSIYTGTSTTFTTTPTTASATLIVSESGFRYIYSQLLPGIDPAYVGQSDCSFNEKGDATCFAYVQTSGSTHTFTLAETGYARPVILTVSPSPTSTTTQFGAQPSPGGALGLRAVNSRPLVWTLVGLCIGVWVVL